MEPESNQGLTPEDLNLQLVRNAQIDESSSATENASQSDRPLCLSSWTYYMRREMQEIVPGVFLGPFAAAAKKSEEKLREAGITHIVMIRSPNETRVIKANFPDTIQYLSFELWDNIDQNIIQYIPQANQFIDDCLAGNGKVLVHGVSGTSRSASIMIAYLMTRKLIGYEEAFDLVNLARSCINLNEGFIRQLLEYELIVSAQISQPSSSGVYSNQQLKRPHDEPMEEE